MSKESRKPPQQYTAEYKAEAVKMVQEIGNGQASIELGVPPSTLSHWVSDARIGKIDTGAGTQTPQGAMTLAADIKQGIMRVICGADPRSLLCEYVAEPGRYADHTILCWEEEIGYLQSRERYKTYEEILETARQFREREIPIYYLILDWLSWEEGKWGNKRVDKTRFLDLRAWWTRRTLRTSPS